MSKFSLYIHFPYCEKKCPYCDFNSHVATRPFQQDSFLQAYLKELDWFKNNTDYSAINSIFFGGGTPSLMPPRLADDLLQHIGQNWQLDSKCEITLEANPSSVEVARLKDFHQSGVNRLSLGVQSFDDSKLRFLGRVHDAKAAHQALQHAIKIFDNFSFDLIYACKDELLSDWRDELQQALDYHPPHLSCYQLTIEPNTHFAKMAQHKQLSLPDNADFIKHNIQHLTAHHMPAYEISNHAKQDYICKHNLNYWQGGDYAGIGPGAHSRITLNGARHHAETIKNPDKWQATLTEKSNAFAELTALKADIHALEKLMMGLRLKAGITLSDAEFLLIINPDALHQHEDYITHQQTDKQHHLRLTKKGWLFLNHVLERITKDDIFN
ncbi:MAG: radical SAM family heme chaperone HemW [Alphaproteobacteria bacterium]|nr:radical SAM family heme chaperone HemW [Alphaproteobacteria bacterium]